MPKSPRKDPAVLAREYIYDASVPPISITALADKHGYARSHMADMARKGIGLTQPNGGSLKSWYEARKEVRYDGRREGARRADRRLGCHRVRRSATGSSRRPC